MIWAFVDCAFERTLGAFIYHVFGYCGCGKPKHLTECTSTCMNLQFYKLCGDFNSTVLKHEVSLEWSIWFEVGWLLADFVVKIKEKYLSIHVHYQSNWNQAYLYQLFHSVTAYMHHSCFKIPFSTRTKCTRTCKMTLILSHNNCISCFLLYSLTFYELLGRCFQKRRGCLPYLCTWSMLSVFSWV